MGKVGRPPKDDKAPPIQPALPAGTRARLEYLAKMGMHGDTPTEVARFLICEGVTRLWREGKIPDKVPASKRPAANSPPTDETGEKPEPTE